MRPPEPDVAPRQEDSRLQAFAAFLEAVDRRDWRTGQLATRELRKLGFSVCLTKPQGEGGPTT